MQMRARWSDIILRRNSRNFHEKKRAKAYVCDIKNAILRSRYRIRELARHTSYQELKFSDIRNKIKSPNNFDVICRVCVAPFYYIPVTSFADLFNARYAHTNLRIYKFAE